MFQQPQGSAPAAAAAAAKLPEAVSQTIKSAQETIGNTMAGFSSKAVSSSTEFLNSNSIVARISFIILVIIVSIVVFKIGTKFVGWLMSPTRNPYIIKGLVPGNMSFSFDQDPNTDGSKSVQRSNNQTSGLEFTWSVWLNLNGAPTAGSYAHIFHKGELPIPADPTSTSTPANNGPGLYVYRPTAATDASTLNDNVHLKIVMNTYDSSAPVQTVDLDNIPLKKWVHIAIRMQNTIMDVYVNGTLAQRAIFSQTVPRQNYGKIYVAQAVGNATISGFNGYLSDLRYYDHALTVFGITNIVYAGPNLKPSDATGQTGGGNNFFFNRIWYDARY
jgi:Concanavalin A-like lectin/glucanases superfamily